jgi:hypothetical protein
MMVNNINSKATLFFSGRNFSPFFKTIVSFQSLDYRADAFKRDNSQFLGIETVSQTEQLIGKNHIFIGTFIMSLSFA